MTQLSTLAGQQQHYSAVRNRLYKSEPRPVEQKIIRVVRSNPPKPKPVEPIAPASDTCPINMLAPPSWRFLVALAALKHGVKAQDIIGHSRAYPVAQARHDAVALICSHQMRSLPDIGRLLGRDHTTILHSVKLRGAEPLANNTYRRRRKAGETK